MTIDKTSRYFSKEKTKSIVATMIIALSFTTVKARLDETSAECKKRYGSPIFSRQTPGTDKFFSWKEVNYRTKKLEVTVCYIDDKAVKIIFTGPYSTFAETNVGEAIRANATGYTWTKSFEVPSSIYDNIRGPYEWSRSDGGWAEYIVFLTMNKGKQCQLIIFSSKAIRSVTLRKKVELYHTRSNP